MTSRTASPLSVRSSSPGRRPAVAAGEPGATATTRAVGMCGFYVGLPAWPPLEVEFRQVGGTLRTDARRARPACPAPRLLRRCRDGDQGAVVDGARLRAARVLLPRDRPQPSRGRSVPRSLCGLHLAHGQCAAVCEPHALAP